MLECDRADTRRRADHGCATMLDGLPDGTLDAVQATVGRRFNNKSILREALTHASIADSRSLSNERLEFLGDAVLGLVVCEELHHRFPDALEGELTKIKSTVVSRKTCAEIIAEMGLDRHLQLGKGMLHHATLPGSVSAALLEALVGAIYIDAGGHDGGLLAVREFLMPLIEPLIRDAAECGHQQNFKSVLQQHAQDRLGVVPIYVLLDEQGPDHAKCFEVCVQLGADRYESAWGQSKKDAEQRAALHALTELGVLERDNTGTLRIVETDSADADAD